MTVTSAKMTLAEFLNYDDGTDTLYELENGELIPMPAESEINRRIAMFLLIYFNQLGIPPHRLTMKTEVAVSSRQVSVRVPDLMVLSEELALALAGASRSIVLMDIAVPAVTRYSKKNPPKSPLERGTFTAPLRKGGWGDKDVPHN
ncbi:MAG: Uma2 family endonuclease, partial [Symploca sp. SIO2E6]|nr:Uma2 family endonuclease [Symploca sp. SIO2E6]